MRTVTEPEQIRETEPCSLALGAFDGLHRGHMTVIRAAAEPPFSDRAGVLTFSSSPSGGEALITAAEKEELLQAAGISRLYSLCFSQVKDIPAEEFFQTTLVERCRAKKLCCGEDFRFGKDARGDVVMLRRLCGEAGIELTVLPAIEEDGEKISSTRIRGAVKQGDIPTANRLLGRPFGYAGEVVHGNHIGTGLGFPTINQPLPEHFATPPFGVYASFVKINGEKHVSVTNIGVKPTVGSDKVLAETWIPAFSGDLYGKRLRLSLLQFIRPERKFASLEELKKEIQKNAEQAEMLTARDPFFLRE